MVVTLVIAVKPRDAETYVKPVVREEVMAARLVTVLMYQHHRHQEQTAKAALCV